MNQISLSQVFDILYQNASLEVSEEAWQSVDDCYAFLEQFAQEKVIYGINTGFGPMAQWRVEDAHLKELQYNIIRSHSTGAGEPLEDRYVRAAMIARIGSFLQGKSGVHREVVELLQAFVNHGIIPFVPKHGSVGASGDLVQLAHIALCLIGEGKVHVSNRGGEGLDVPVGLAPTGREASPCAPCLATTVLPGDRTSMRAGGNACAPGHLTAGETPAFQVGACAPSLATTVRPGDRTSLGEWRPTAEVMAEYGLRPIDIHIREGLSATNGTSVMTGISMVNQFDAENLLQRATLASVWMNEIAASYDDLMSAPLNECRRHAGQIHIAAEMRRIATGSQCLQSREHALYDNGHADDKVFDHKVQAYYSLRCIPQIYGPIWETLQNSRRVLEEELNAASDNPIVDPETRNVYHGGNFHGDYISLEEDKVKIALVRLVMTCERQLNYLFHDRINGILPPFLNMGTLGLNYGMQACQFTATSTTAECQTLAMPNYVHSIPNNNDNQDIVSMGTNTAELCAKVIENAYQVMAILYMALAQATDCLGIREQLAPATRAEYEAIRAITPTIVEDTPFYEDIEKVIGYLTL
ncbi:MAG: histidine ammonia-lyase [Paludibacteraceae bacterium]